jgi:hypothetical protein
VSTTVFFAMKANGQVLDGFLDIVADLDLAFHADSAWRQRFWRNDHCLLDFAKQNRSSHTITLAR